MNLRRFLTSHWAVYLAMLASALPLAAILAASSPMPEGACSGIGFGCSLYGWDVAAFALMILGVPYAILVGVVLAVLSLLPDRFRAACKPVAWVAFVLPWFAVLPVAL